LPRRRRKIERTTENTGVRKVVKVHGTENDPRIEIGIKINHAIKIDTKNHHEIKTRKSRGIKTNLMTRTDLGIEKIEKSPEIKIETMATDIRSVNGERYYGMYYGMYCGIYCGIYQLI
jgi:hypothetical protein